MKKVILQEKSNEVYLSNLNPDDILAMTTGFGNKFFLSKTSLGYEWVGKANITSSSKANYNYFKESFKTCQDVFIFETYEELFKWMSE